MRVADAQSRRRRLGSPRVASTLTSTCSTTHLTLLLWVSCRRRSEQARELAWTPPYITDVQPGIRFFLSPDDAICRRPRTAPGSTPRSRRCRGAAGGSSRASASISLSNSGCGTWPRGYGALVDLDGGLPRTTLKGWRRGVLSAAAALRDRPCLRPAGAQGQPRAPVRAWASETMITAQRRPLALRASAKLGSTSSSPEF